MVGLHRLISMVLLLLACVFCTSLSRIGSAASSLNATAAVPPPAVKIGALVSVNTTLGLHVQQAIELAVRDVNNDAEEVLNGTKLVLEMFGGGDDSVQDAACAVELMKRGVVAVVGPSSSSAAQFASHIGQATKVPFVSYGASDPNFSEMYYPYFIRVVPSDALLMEAVASFIVNYRWKEAVVFHMDDDSGANGASCLSDSLQMRGSRLVGKVPLVPWLDKSTIVEKLAQVNQRQSRVYVLHTHPDVGFRLIQEAYDLKMLEYGYVWITTGQMTISIQNSHLDAGIVKISQGIIGIQPHVSPSSSRLQGFFTSWDKNFGGHPDQMNPYALYAYDALWAISYGLASYFKDGNGSFRFHSPVELPVVSGGESELAKMQILERGEILKDDILRVRFQGASGMIKFDETGDVIGAAFDYTNMVGRNPNVVGYWWASNQTNTSGSISLSPPTDRDLLNLANIQRNYSFVSSDASPPNTTKLPVIWPGGRTDTPRGWALPQNGRSLKIGVPRKAGYNELVGVTLDAQNGTMIVNGFCIEVFKAALMHLHYDVPYQFQLLGDGLTTPQYDDLIKKLANEEYDGVVGDVAILADRLQVVDFTQPYIESGLVVLAPLNHRRRDSPWAFLRPFTSTLWVTVFFSCMFTGMVIWILERRRNVHFQGPPKKQFVTVFTFIFSTLFFAHREDTKSILGRIVLLFWLFVILIINSNYTANLTSILTVEQLLPTIQGLDSLLRTNLPIGYQTGSFVRQYLINLNVNPGRLKDLQSREMYEYALNLGPAKGGVAAIVDELPYVELLEVSNCKKYTVVGQEFTKSGWGFAFPRGSEITADLSEAILQMSQSGELQRIRDYWFKNDDCQQGTADAVSSQLNVYSFWGLFLISGLTSVFALVVRLGTHLVRCGSPRLQNGVPPTNSGI